MSVLCQAYGAVLTAPWRAIELLRACGALIAPRIGSLCGPFGQATALVFGGCLALCQDPRLLLGSGLRGLRYVATRRYVWAIGGCYAAFVFVRAVRVTASPWTSEGWSMIYTRFIDVCTSDVFADQRSKFTSLALVNPVTRKNHSHGKAAAMRNAESNLLQTIARSMGFEPYCVSMSPSDQRRDLDGSRLYHFAKDLKMRSQRDPLLPTHCLILVDVDYYFDYTYLLDGCPVLITTFAPERPAGISTDYDWSVCDDVCYMNVRGMSNYQHKLWDYCGDTLVVRGLFSTMVYAIEKRTSLDPNRKLVFLSPIRRVLFPASLFVSGPTLCRKKITFGSVNWMRSVFNDSTGTVVNNMLSLNAVGSSASVAVPDKTFAAAYLKWGMTKDPLVGTIERIVNHDGVDDAPLAAALLFTLMPAIGEYPKPTDPGVVVDGHTYQTTKPLVLDDGASSLRTVGKPLVVGRGFAPAKSYNNDICMQSGRIDAVAPRATPTSQFYSSRCFNAFVEQFCRGFVGKVVPVSFEQVDEKQNRPSQRSLFRAAKESFFTGNFIVKSFQKREAYPKITHPRNICTVPTDHKVRLSCFTYGFYEMVLKEMPWYAFGRDPAGIAEHVTEICTGVTQLLGTDFSRLDGSTNRLLSDVYIAVMLTCQSLDHRGELAKLLEDERFSPGVTSFGLLFNTNTNTNSGSAATAARNSIILCFSYFCVFMKMGMTPEAAWQAVCRHGMFGGDDGLQGGADPAVAMTVFRDLDLIAKMEIHKRGEPVLFLGRVFLEPWTCCVCIADVPRQISKLHLTTADKAVPDVAVMLRKAEAILITDPKTPILSNWARMVVRNCNQPLTASQRKLTEGEVSWFARAEGNNFTGPRNDDERALAVKQVAMALGIEECEVQAYSEYLDECGDLNVEPIIHVAPRVEVPAVLGGELLQPNAIPASKTGPALNVAKMRKRDEEGIEKMSGVVIRPAVARKKAIPFPRVAMARSQDPRPPRQVHTFDPVHPRPSQSERTTNARVRIAAVTQAAPKVAPPLLERRREAEIPLVAASSVVASPASAKVAARAHRRRRKTPPGQRV